jgi:pyruvate dehydrogenase E2 component (dihydrolipoamide acetyltransferase)
MPAAASAPRVAAAASPVEPNGGGVVTSPLVRRMIAEQGLDPSQIHGTGEGGRITRNDVAEASRGRGGTWTAPPQSRVAPQTPPQPEPEPELQPEPRVVLPPPEEPEPELEPVADDEPFVALAEEAPVAEAPAPVVAPVAPAPAAPVAPVPVVAAPQPADDEATAAEAAPRTGDEIIPFDNIRRRTAEHMVRSKATSAHVYTSVRVDFERIERSRRAHQAEWKKEEGFSLTYLPFIVRAFCDVIHEFPNVNASVDGESLVVHRDLHLGIAVDLDFKGLVAPIVRNADGKRLRQVAREIRDLAARAKSKQLGPDDVLGGTFTITNMGPFGTTLTLPIINQPQVAIMATDAIRKEPVVIESPEGEDSIAIHHVGVLALAWDHRAFDGAYAASFLNEVRKVLETRDWDAELA